MKYACSECPKKFRTQQALAGHLSAHRRGLIGGKSGGRKEGETHRRKPLSLGNLVESIIEDPRIIGDIAAGLGRLIGSFSPGKKKEERPPADDELERRVGRTVLNAMIRESTKHLIRQLQPTIRAQTELAVLGPELEKIAGGEVMVRAAETVVASSNPEPDHFITEEDVAEAWSE